MRQTRSSIWPSGPGSWKQKPNRKQFQGSCGKEARGACVLLFRSFPGKRVMSGLWDVRRDLRVDGVLPGTSFAFWSRMHCHWGILMTTVCCSVTKVLFGPNDCSKLSLAVMPCWYWAWYALIVLYQLLHGNHKFTVTQIKLWLRLYRYYVLELLKQLSNLNVSLEKKLLLIVFNHSHDCLPQGN